MCNFEGTGEQIEPGLRRQAIGCSDEAQFRQGKVVRTRDKAVFALFALLAVMGAIGFGMMMARSMPP